jgi:Protein of unknown function (DUF2865)
MRLYCVNGPRPSAWRHVCLAIGFIVAGAAPAEAQGLFEGLFGWGNKPAPQAPASGLGNPAPAPAAVLTPGGQPFPQSGVRQSLPPPQPSSTSEPSNSGRVKTVCVRMCDGYYFPVNTATQRAHVNKDASLCKASCGAEGRLFTLPVGSTEMDTAVDLSGRPYSRMPIAFKYRKSLVEGCRCRPEPWTEAEMSRHRAYAKADTENPKQDKRGETPNANVAAAEPQMTADVAVTASEPTTTTGKPSNFKRIVVERKSVAAPPETALVAARTSRQQVAQQPASSQPAPVRLAPPPAPAPSVAAWSWPQQKYAWPGETSPPPAVRRY